MTAAPSYRCIITDDDEIDRLTTIAFVKKFPQFEIAGIYASAEETLRGLGEQAVNIDIAFFDVDMPGLSGLDLRRRLDPIPATVFITSYPDYAVESFELAALDFLVKPVKAERFALTVKRIEDYFAVRQKAALLDHHLGGDVVTIKEGYEQVKLPLHTIIYLEALKDYTCIVTQQGKHHVLCSLGNLLKENAFSGFARIHKSYAVQPGLVQSVKSNEITIQNIKLPVGRTYRDTLSLLQKNGNVS